MKTNTGHNEINSHEKLKVAFLGGGVNSAVGRTHRIAIEMDQRFELVAGCFSQNPEINYQTSLSYGIPSNRVYQNLEKLIKNESTQIDAIVILTPTPHHSADVITSLKAGIPVICEKAIATSSMDAMKIKKTLEDRNGFLSVTYNYTGYPMLRELKRMIQEENFGELEQIHIEMPQEGFAKLDRDSKPLTPQAWRLHDEDLPTISLDLGVHLHNIIYFLTKEKPIELVAVNNSFGSFRQVVDNTICIAKYTNNLVCNIWYSKAALGHRNGLRIRVFGDAGSAEWYQMDPEILYFNDNKGHKSIIDRACLDVKVSPQPRYNRFKSGHPSGFIEAFANYYCDIADNLQQYIDSKNILRTEYLFGISEALEGLYMLEAISRSSTYKTWVKIND